MRAYLYTASMSACAFLVAAEAAFAGGSVTTPGPIAEPLARPRCLSSAERSWPFAISGPNAKKIKVA